MFLLSKLCQVNVVNSRDNILIGRGVCLCAVEIRC